MLSQATLMRGRVFLVAAIVVVIWIGPGALAQESTLSLHEAEILVRLLPPSIQTVDAGFQVGWTDDVDGNREDFYLFHLFNASRRGSVSTTLGFYAVNKRTATVVDTATMDVVQTPLLRSIQEVIRRAHHIDDRVIFRFDDLLPLTKRGSAER